MDHFPTNWGRPVRLNRVVLDTLSHISCSATMLSTRTEHTPSLNVPEMQLMYLQTVSNTLSRNLSISYAALPAHPAAAGNQ